MKVSQQQQTREEKAWAEVGHTAIRPIGAAVLAGVFLAVIFAVPIYQAVMDARSARERGEVFVPPVVELARQMGEALEPVREQGLRPATFFAANRNLLGVIQEHEDAREDDSRLGQRVRPVIQGLASRWLGMGNEQVYLGRDGWLFYRPGIDALTGPPFLSGRQLARRAAAGSELVAAPQPDPREAILDAHRQLAERGITLVVMPTPVKPTIHPEQFSRRFRGWDQPLHNPSYLAFVRDLEAAGVVVYDPSEVLTGRGDDPQYLATDTHWRPEAMEAVAADLADFLRARGLVSERGGMSFVIEEAEVSNVGDVVPMLDLAGDQTLFPQETVNLRRVLDDARQFWRPSVDAPVLLLGDSFSNIYSLEPMGWGESGGFAEHLSAALGLPLDRLVRNDAGAYATRDMLSREMSRGRDRLDGKQVVVWQFAARELAVGDWRMISFDVGEAPAESFVVPEPGETLEVRGVVREVSPVPRPGTVPYRDHVVSVHLVDLPDDGQAVVYLRSMTDGEWTSAARLRVGDEVSLRLRPWADVADQYDGLNRSELDDVDLQLQEPCWGDVVR